MELKEGVVCQQQDEALAHRAGGTKNTCELLELNSKHKLFKNIPHFFLSNEGAILCGSYMKPGIKSF
jgi:hypothetical protein